MTGLYTLPLHGQDGADKKNEPDVREETLKFGIDSDVLTVLGDLQAEKNSRYNVLLTAVAAETRSAAIRQGIFRLWDETSYRDGFPLAREELAKVLEDDEYDIPSVQSALAYLAGQGDTDSLSALGELADERESAIAASAVRGIGTLAGGDNRDRIREEQIEYLGRQLLDRLTEEDPSTEEDLIAAIIVTLGALEYNSAADTLLEIAVDEGASAGHRRLACVSVGQIGRLEDFHTIENLYFEEDDATLRSYALAGLADFPGQDITDILIQALKRDSFWRIRLTAAEKLGESKGEEVGELLRYKAGNDPVSQVRIAALKSLGRIGSEVNETFLIDCYKDSNKGTDVRLAALSVLVEHRIPGTVEAVGAEMDRLWTRDTGRFLEFTCRDLSAGEWVDLGPVFDRMLDHPNWLIQVYGVRGIRRNGIQSLYGRIEALDADGVDPKVRREAATGG